MNDHACKDYGMLLKIRKMTPRYPKWLQPYTSTTPLPMRYASMGYTSMGTHLWNMRL
jgi:hypothetical protein